MSEKLSIVIPAYNEEKNIAKCINELQVRPAREARDSLRDHRRQRQQQGRHRGAGPGRDGDGPGDPDRQPDAAGRVRPRGPLRAGGGHGGHRRRLHGRPLRLARGRRRLLPQDPRGIRLRLRLALHQGERGPELSPASSWCVNRIVNRCIQFMFWTRFNDLTNAFKAYRTAVIRDCGPYRACHFNLTLEMSLGALIRELPHRPDPDPWYGRTWGSSNLKLGEMGRRYLSTLLMMFFQRYLIADDLLADRLASRSEQLPLPRRTRSSPSRRRAAPGHLGAGRRADATEDGEPPTAAVVLARQGRPRQRIPSSRSRLPPHPRPGTGMEATDDGLPTAPGPMAILPLPTPSSRPTVRCPCTPNRPADSRACGAMHGGTGCVAASRRRPPSPDPPTRRGMPQCETIIDHCRQTTLSSPESLPSRSRLRDRIPPGACRESLGISRW